MHLSRHIYKRGQFKGDAPADSSRRAKSHFRVVKGNGGQMIVRMHNTDIITAYEDGRIVLNTRGWSTSPTTRRCMNESLRGFFGMGYLYSVRKGGYSQTGIRMNGKTYRYYDGMECGADGTLLSVAKVFTAKRTDREETAEFRKEIKDSGFVDMFPVLYQAAEASRPGFISRIKEKMCSADDAEYWPAIVSMYKYPTYLYQQKNVPKYATHKQALRAIVASFTKHMTKFVETDVTVL
jgi:hypothetical protein